MTEAVLAEVDRLRWRTLAAYIDLAQLLTQSICAVMVSTAPSLQHQAQPGSRSSSTVRTGLKSSPMMRVCLVAVFPNLRCASSRFISFMPVLSSRCAALAISPSRHAATGGVSPVPMSICCFHLSAPAYILSAIFWLADHASKSLSTLSCFGRMILAGLRRRSALESVSCHRCQLHTHQLSAQQLQQGSDHILYPT